MLVLCNYSVRIESGIQLIADARGMRVVTHSIQAKSVNFVTPDQFLINGGFTLIHNFVST